MPSLEETLKDISWVLFGTVLAIVYASIPAQCSLSSIERNTNKIATELKKANERYQAQEKNVRGLPAPETFYDTPDGRAYLKIDGIPVDEYLDRTPPKPSS